MKQTVTQQAASALSAMQTHKQTHPLGERKSVKISATEHFKIFFLRILEKKHFKAANNRLRISFHASYKILVLSFSIYLQNILHMMFCTVKVQSTPHS